MEGEVITMTDIFAFEQVGYENGKVMGRLRATGLRPKCLEKIEDSGVRLAPSIFMTNRR
jgi:pilus assembly protein CpaF